MLETRHNPIERAKQIDARWNNSPLQLSQLTLSSGQVNLRGLVREGTSAYLGVLIDASLITSGNCDLKSDLITIYRLQDRLMEREQTKRHLSPEEEHDFYKELSPDTIINIEALLKKLRMLKNAPAVNTGQYL